MIYIKNTLNRYCKNDTKKEKRRIVLTNRGFQSVLMYRISNLLYKKRLGILSMFLTRIIQILYSVDIDYRAEIEEGLIIFHGVGLVIGSGVKIGKNCTPFHNPTLGLKFSKSDKQFPTIGNNCLIGTGSILLGNIAIPDNKKIRAGTVQIYNGKNIV